MKKISYQRIGEYLQTALKVAVEHGGAYPVKDILEEVGKRIDLNEYERQSYEKSGYIRWQSITHFYSIDLTKAGWLRKHKGSWYVTDEGRKALELDPEKFIQEASKKYREWALTREPEKVKEDDMEVAGYSATTSYEQAQSTAREEIKAYIRNLQPYDFQDIVAALFRGLGY